MHSALKKLIIIAGIGAALFAGYVADSIIVKSYSIDVLSIRRSGDENMLDANDEVVPLDCGVTDGETKVTMNLLLTRNGNPVSGHTMYVITNKNVIGRFITDENGQISVDYRCYKANNAKAVKDITVSVKDENNSVFVSVPCKTSFVITMKQAKQNENIMKTDDFFFDV